MDFKKRFDYLDINNFLPDNMTLAKADYFENKFNNKLPDGYSSILEAKSRIEFSEEDEKIIIDEVMKQQQEYFKKLLKEYEQRELEGLENSLEEMSITFKPKTNNNIIIISDNNINE